MDAVLVYRFEVVDAATRAWVAAPHPATLVAINRLRGRVVQGSARQVFASAVGYDGIFTRSIG